MSFLVRVVRRWLWLLLIAAAGGALYSWWRDRSTSSIDQPAQWPPLDASGDAAANRSAKSGAPAEPEHASGSSTKPARAASDSSSGSAAGGSGSSSVVNALVDAPEARSPGGSTSEWIEPDTDGNCPLSHPIKANDNSGIYHVPDGRFYERTQAERCYTTADAAEADGYRRSKS